MENLNTTTNTNDIDMIINNNSMNTSQKIKTLDKLGLTRGAIAKLLNKRYQHVRNVLITPIKKI